MTPADVAATLPVVSAGACLTEWAENEKSDLILKSRFTLSAAMCTKLLSVHNGVFKHWKSVHKSWSRVFR